MSTRDAIRQNLTPSFPRASGLWFMIVFALLVMSLASAATALAAPAAPAGPLPLQPEVAPLQAPSLSFSVIRVMGALALVVALLLGGVWLFRNWQRLTLPRGRAPKLSVLEVKPLGARHALYVVGYEQQRFLLSAAPAGISLLTALPAAASAETETQTAPAPAFADILSRVLNQGAGK